MALVKIDPAFEVSIDTTGLAAGNYTMYVKVTDVNGKTTTFGPVTITMSPKVVPPPPVLVTPAMAVGIVAIIGAVIALAFFLVRTVRARRPLPLKMLRTIVGFLIPFFL
jgi:hypothetical protein